MWRLQDKWKEPAIHVWEAENNIAKIEHKLYSACLKVQLSAKKIRPAVSRIAIDYFGASYVRRAANSYTCTACKNHCKECARSIRVYVFNGKIYAKLTGEHNEKLRTKRESQMVRNKKKNIKKNQKKKKESQEH